MALPKKKRGFRKIMVNGFTYYWRFHKLIDIRPNGQKNNMLLIDIGWYDEWLYANDAENKPTFICPRAITPKFIEKIIIDSLNLGWNKTVKNNLLEVTYNWETDTLNKK